MGVQINRDEHKVVVVVNAESYGFTTLSTAILFVEEIFKGEDSAKLFDRITEAMSDDKADDLKIYEIELYADLFMDDEEDNDEESF